MFIELTVRIDKNHSKKELFNIDKISNITTSNNGIGKTMICFENNIFRVVEDYNYIKNKLDVLVLESED